MLLFTGTLTTPGFFYPK